MKEESSNIKNTKLIYQYNHYFLVLYIHEKKQDVYEDNYLKYSLILEFSRNYHKFF